MTRLSRPFITVAYLQVAFRPIRLHRLELEGFRNYIQLELDVIEKRLLIIGSNGVGKSNLLEAVELLGSLRSHRCSRDQDLIHWNKTQSLLRAIANDGDQLQLELRRRGGRKAYLNEKPLVRQLDLIGPLRCVCFSALDLDLVRGEPVLRRNWLDRVVQQLEPVYSELTGRYNKLLRQRSHFWRNLANHSSQDRLAMLDAFDTQMALVSTRIHRRRKRALGHLQPLAAKWQETLSNGKEKFTMTYEAGSVLEGEEEEKAWRISIEEQLLGQRVNEERLGHCSVGPHRDEIGFLINGVLARRFASAGQQRTIVLALKLAELDLVSQIYGEPALLLLDDVLAELDKTRQLLLLEAVGEQHQSLITATHLDGFARDWQADSQIVEAQLFRDLGNVK
ncbi:DNA replication/repair protein RecF [Prochlorococcus sp. MIT 1341]|uniref:DNA replication/repair protein RecF n=1 Tax=Prochlorococcus sp. MIT 1341 TaxID=3096221 RepID=UPI002A75802C|nr:DNA replication/repair protein RecF [Prochlorococcus sp. MIT 1341]